jgi:tetratricopeptide (TPR) repeat protein
VSFIFSGAIVKNSRSNALLRKRLESAGMSDLAEAIDWPATPSRSLSKMLQIAFGYLLLILIMLAVGLVPFYFLDQLGTSKAAALIIQYISFPIAIALTVPGFLRMGRHWNRESSKYPELALFDRRQPVLYLRRFVAENPNIANEAAPRIGLFGFVKILDRVPFERAVERATARVGKLICLGDPRFQREGGRVARFYAQDEKWQQAVEALARVSGPVFIHYVPGGSVEWEIDRFLNRDTRPVAVWIEDCRLLQSKELPEPLTQALRRYGFKFESVNASNGPAILFLFANGHLLSTTAAVTRQGLQRALSALLKHARLSATYTSIKRPPVLVWTRMVERSPMLVAWGLPLALIAAPFIWYDYMNAPVEKLEEMYWQADYAEDRLDFAAAEQHYTDALRYIDKLGLDDSYAFSKLIHYRPALHAGRCWARASMAEIENARFDCDAMAQYFQRSGSGQPDLRFYLGAGLIALHEGDYTLALDHYQAFLARYPNGEFSGPAYYGQGLALQALGRSEDAKASLDRAIAFNQSVANAFAGVPLPEVPVQQRP